MSVEVVTPATIDISYDTAKRTKGRKQHLLVEALGQALAASVLVASVGEMSIMNNLGSIGLASGVFL